MSVARIYASRDLKLEEWQDELVVGILNIVAAFGCMACGPFSDRSI